MEKNMPFKWEKIKEIRKEQRLSLRKVSERTKQIDPKGKGVTTSTIQRLESGTRDNPRIETLCMILQAVGIRNINKFINWEYFQGKKSE
jgi:transcriptional regulator with XRE-family HTH domain